MTPESFADLDICCELIEKKYGGGRIDSWTNGDYVKLSASILRETGTLISANTLKRIFGKIKTSSRYYPQKATRDALALYAGFTGWESLKESRPLSLTSEKGAGRREVKTAQKAVSGKRLLVLAGGLLGAGMLCLAVWLGLRPGNTAPGMDNISLTCRNPVGGNPHSAIFTLNLPPDLLHTSAIFDLDFGDGKDERLTVRDTLITHYYEIPGRYFAVLKYKQLPIDTVAVFLRTEDWTATATMMHDTTRVYPVINTPLTENGKMSVSSSALYNAGIDTNRTFFVHFVLSKPMNISGDNFVLEADVRTSPVRPGVRCSQVDVTVFGENTNHHFAIIKPGCVTWPCLRFSEVVKDGKYNDLSFLGADLAAGGSFRLEVAKKSVKLWINNSLVHRTKYHIPLNEIKGLQFTFAGIGDIEQVYLEDLETGVTYKNDFSK